MIEVDLHPDRHRGGRNRSRIALPKLDRSWGWQEFRADPWHRTFLVCVVLVPLVVGPAWLAQRSELAGLRAVLEEARTDSARLAGRSALGDSLSERRRTMAERIEGMRALDRDRYAWPRLTDEFSRSLPAGAWLTALTTERQAPDIAVRIEGMARTPLEITEYVRTLKASPFVDGVRIRATRRVAQRRGYGQSFSLSVSYRQPPPDRRRTRPLPRGEG